MSVISGSCGDSTTFRLEEDGTIYIEGTGAMSNWNNTTSSDMYYQNAPWYQSMADGLITKVVVESGVTNVGDYAFFTGASIVSASTSETVTVIGICAFMSCTSLVDLKMAKGLQTISVSAFRGCTSLADLNLPETVTTLGRIAFYSCKALKKVVFPSKLTTFENEVFRSCTGLKSIYFKQTAAPTFGAGVFKATNSTMWCLTSGSWGSADVFANAATDSSDISVSSTWHYVEYRVGPTVYMDLDVDTGTITLTGEGATYSTKYTASDTPFHGNMSSFKLRKIVIEEGVTTIGQYLFFWANTSGYCTEIIFPSTLVTIYGYAFKYITGKSFVKLRFKEGLKTIYAYAFSECKVRAVIFPKSATAIQGYQFDNNGSYGAVIVSTNGSRPTGTKATWIKRSATEDDVINTLYSAFVRIDEGWRTIDYDRDTL